MNDDDLIEELAGMLVRIERNYERETSGPGSRFEGQRLEVVQARAVLRRVLQASALWVCYCGAVAPHSNVFPHWDCQGARPLRPDEVEARRAVRVLESVRPEVRSDEDRGLMRVRQEPRPLWAAAERALAEGRLKPLPRMPSVRPESDYEMHLPEEGA